MNIQNQNQNQQHARPKLQQAFDYSLRKAVEAYHEYHGDKNVHLIRFVCDPCGDSLLLTRVTDADGHKMSVLLECNNWSGVWNINEDRSCSREEEYCMLCSIVTGKEWQSIMDEQAMFDDDFDQSLEAEYQSREDSREHSRYNAENHTRSVIQTAASTIPSPSPSEATVPAAVSDQSDSAQPDSVHSDAATVVSVPSVFSSSPI